MVTNCNHYFIFNTITLRWRPLVFFSIVLLSLCASFNSIAQTETYNWSNVAMGGGGFVSGIITSKAESGLIYARTDVGGAYRWDATNGKWIPLLDWVSENETGYLGVESLATDPSNSNNLYMLVGTSYFNSGKTAILRSTNKGNSFSITDVTSQFKASGNGLGRQSGEKLVVDPNNGTILFCGTRDNGLFKSTNSGVSWTSVSSLSVTSTSNGNGICFVVFDPSSGSTGSATQTIIAGISSTGTNLYKSTNGGTSFTAISGAPTTLTPQRAVLASDKNLYITYANGVGPYGASTAEPMDTGQIWKYNLTTGVWTNVTPSGFTRAFSGISVDPNNASRLMASSINTYNTQGGAYGDWFFLSTDGGASWTNVVTRGYSLDNQGVTWMTSSQSIHWAGSIEFDPFNTSVVWVTSGNGIFRNDNINATAGVWKFMVKGLEETVPFQIETIPNGGPILTSIGDYDGFYQTSPSTYGPQFTPSIGTVYGMAVAPLSTTKVVRVGNSSMYYSTNTGQSWTQASTMNGTFGQVALSADGAVILHSPGNSSTTTYKSTNNGTSWTTVTGLSITEARPVTDPAVATKFYAYNPSNGAMMVSTNSGTSFSQAGTTTSGGSKLIRLAPGREGHIWVALYGGGLSRSTNSGSTFSTISGVTYCGAVGFGKAATGATYPTLYIWGTVNGILGVYRSINEGSSWVRVNDDAHEYGGPGNGQFVQGDINVYGRVYMSTVGRGIVYGESTTASLSVSSTSLSFGSTASSQTVTVTSNTTWSVASNQTWLTVSPSSGSNNGSFTATVTANTTSASRSATITVTGGGITQTISVTQASLPSPWQTADIGAVATTGSASYNSGTFTAVGSGADIWGTADEFRYVYQPVIGDGEIKARVVSLTNTNTWAKAGVMIRQSLTAGSVHAMTVQSVSNGIVFQRRTATSGSSANTAGPSVTAPYWVRLVKSGTTITSYASTNGTTWTQIGSITLTLSGTYYMGLAVTSHNDGTLCTAAIDNVTVTAAAGRLATSSESDVLQEGEPMNSKIQVYPNPVGDKLTVMFNKELQGGKYVLMNTTGNTILTENIEELERTHDTSQLPSGLYVICVTSKGQRYVYKVLKK